MSPLIGAMLAALVCVGAYTAMNILFKRHAGAGGGALHLTAWLGLLAPLWGLLLGLGAPTHLLVLPPAPAYYAWCLLWALLLPGTTLLMVHLLKTLSLSELTSARKALVTLLAVGVDYFLLGTTFTVPLLLAVGVITVAALNLPAPPRKKIKPLPLRVRTVWLLLLAALFTLQLLAYKRALAYQPDLVSHIVVIKLAAALCCLPLFFFMGKGPKQRPAAGLILGVVVCYFVGSVAEGYALRGLPLTVLVAITTATAALMALHDLIRKDLPRTGEAFAMLALIFAGFALLAFAG
ncbi:MAG TPA: hypothetical protein VHP58_01095 [Alphaproteobacteria bacterium]|nr:hypothetical protein [Alphaproteobacteria bacterium]